MTMQKLTATDPETRSPDLVAENIERLKALFPELVTEGPQGAAVNVDVLKSLVGDKTVTDAEEKYGLNWHGKRRARQLALTPSTGTLRPCPEDSVDWDTTQNLMIEGDNLEVLKLLQKSYAGKVKLIYIDPPYNTGKDFVYPDNFHDSIKSYMELTGQLEGGRRVSSNKELSGRYHTDWLNMMLPRLKVARDLLREDGVIFISIDDHEVCSLRLLCDEIFGEENFLATLVWQHSVQPKGYSGTFSVHHNFVLCYQKSDRFQLSNVERTDEHNKNYSNPDDDPKGDWRPGDVRNALYRPNLIYSISTPSGRTIPAPANGWRWSKETMQAKIASGEVIFSPDETRIIRKIYLAGLDGRTPETILLGKEVGTTRDAAAEIKRLFDGAVPFDTPKPIGLVKHLIRLSGATGQDIVLDFFAGSGTTGEAVWRHNAESSQKLRWILVQLPERLDPLSKEQREATALCESLNKPLSLSELTKERLRRAAKVIGSEGSLFCRELGFRAFRLDTSSFRTWDPDQKDLERTLLDHRDHLKADRSESDVLAELLLRQGVDLCVTHSTRSIEGKTVHCIGGGVLIACLDLQIKRGEVAVLAQGISDWIKELKVYGEVTCVFRDSAFADDVTKTNMALALEQAGVHRVRSL